MPKCEATSKWGHVCQHPEGHRGCHEAWTGDTPIKARTDHRWWGDSRTDSDNHS